MVKATEVAVGARSASKTLRGFEYQLYRSVLEWLQLAEEDQLYLEAGEDILRIRRGEVRHDQVKDRKAVVSLGRADVLQSLGHFWSYRGNGVRATFRFITTGGVGVERGGPFGKGVRGIDVWRQAAAASPEDAAEDVQRLRDFLTKRDKLAGPVRAFLQTAKAADIHRDLIVPFDWITHEPKSEEVEQQAKALLVQIARDGFNIPAIEAESLFPRFVKEVLEVAARRPERALTRERISEIVRAQAYRVVEESQMREIVAAVLGEFLQSGEPQQFAVARATQEPPPVPEGYVRRTRAFVPLQEVLLRSRVAVIVGSVGMGKSALAKDIASQDSIDWRWANLRNLYATELLARLDRVEQDVLGRPSISKLVLDDVEFSDVPSSIVDSLSRIARVLRARNGGLLITASGDPPARVLHALSISARELVRIGAYRADEVVDVMVATFGDIARLAQAAKALRLMTFGHPTLVAARLRRMQQIGLNIDDLLQTDKPPEVHDVEREVRSLVSQLDTGPRELLYRVSIAIVPLEREEVLELASREPAIAEPGLALDRIVGPWLEVADISGALRRSPLVSDLTRQVLDTEAEAQIERDLVEILMRRQPLRSDGVLGILFHALRSRHEQAVGALLASLLQQDEKTIAWAARSVRFLMHWGVDESPPAPFGRNVQLILRTTQFRMASILGDDAAAEKIGKAFERDFPPGKDNAADRFRFFGYVVAYGKKPIAQRTADALRWAEAGTSVVLNPEDLAIGRIAKRGPGAMAAALVLGHITSYEDLDNFVTVLNEATLDAQRQFLAWLADRVHMLRGLFGALQVAEFNRDRPRWDALAASVQRFYDLLRNAGLNDVAAHAADQVVRLQADQLRDPDRALALVDAAEALYPGRPELLSARAFVQFQKHEYESALEMWGRALPDLPKAREDLQPSQDARLAGIAASKLQRLADAERWLSWASTRLSKRFFDVPRVVYGFDAAFAAWKDRRDASVLSKLAELLPLMRRLNDVEDDLAFGAFKRIGHTLAWMSNDREALAALQYHAPEIGAVSALDEVPRSAVASTPFDYIVEEACEFEFQTGLGSQLYDEYMPTSRPDAPPPVRPGGGKVVIAWSLRRRQLEAYAERVVMTSAELTATASQQQTATPNLSGLVDSLAMLGLIAALPTGVADSTLASWANTFGRGGYPDAEAKILRAIEMREPTGNLSLRLLQAAQDANTLGAHETRMLAAIVHGTSGQAESNTLTVCIHYWVDATQRPAIGVGTGGVLLRTVGEMLCRAPLFPLWPKMSEEVTVLVNEGNEVGRPWKKLHLLMMALANATGRHTPSHIEQFLQERVERERRWFEVR